MNHKTGATTPPSNGIHAGSRKTYHVSLPEAWEYLVSPAGVDTWLGVADLQLAPGKSFGNENIQGEIKVIKDLSHIRLLWKRTEWPSYSNLQVRVFRADSGATISFHQDKLGNDSLRAEMLRHWEGVLLGLGEKFRFSQN